MTGPGPGCQDLLRAATVALEVPAPASGEPTRATGFFAAPGIVATCAHVLGSSRDDLPERVLGRLMAADQSIELETVPEWYLRHEAYALDLAFLRVPGPCDAPHVLLSEVIAIRDPMWTYGHPAGQFRAGQSAGFTYQGPSRLQAVESQWELYRVTGTPVGGGYSGSPVLNLRTGAVCGMLCISDEAGSAHMVPAAEIIARCPDGRTGPDSPAVNVHWLEALTDEQISAGGWRFPGPRLRTYLDAAVRAAQDHPYPGVVPGITPPPLTAVYVRQQADTRAAAEEPAADLERRPAEEILDQDEDCILTGGPGVGKSSLLRTALIAQARRWQRGDAGAEIPVHVLASDLVEARPLPDAIAAGVTASLSAVGILNPKLP